jgi:type IV secretory pathway VirB2 component (pilin)
MKHFSRNMCGLLSTVLLTGFVAAQTEGYDIGQTEGGVGIVGSLERFLQIWVNFVTGPFSAFVVVGSLVIGIALWAFAPRFPGMQMVMKGAVAGLAVFNIPNLLQVLQV